ncbi:MAG: hypothetical protein B7X58_15155, partial [Marinobacter sp. 34-60-7]
VPFMFFYNSALLMEGEWFAIARALVTATFGVYLLSGGVMGWFANASAAWFTRILLIIAALLMIEGGLITDVAGVGMTVVAYLIQRQRRARMAPTAA